MKLDWIDYRGDPAAWAAKLGVSVEACELLLASDFIDAHCDLEVPVRVFGWDPAVRHGPWSVPTPLFGHTDYPRLREAGFTGVAYDLVTNIFKGARGRLEVTPGNVARAIARIEQFPDDLCVVRTLSDYRAARESDRLAFWLTIQGANALELDPSLLDGPLGQDLHRITLVHLSSSVLGGSSSPSQMDPGISSLGRDFVEVCNRNRILVDLSHAGERTFWGALEAHDRSIPPIVSHTGVRGVRDHWRNLDDSQLRAIAERGGVVGILYQGNFLARVPPGFPCARSYILDHLEHVIDRVGEDVAAIGTDYDGLITPPYDLADVTHHPLLVQDMLDRRWTPDRVQKVLGTNYLRVVGEVRP